MSFGILPIEDIKSCGVSADTSADQNVADVPSGDITETKFYDTNGEVYATITRPSGDLISRADAIDSINKTNSTLDEIPICKDIRSAFANALKALPSADRPKGKWLDEDGDKVEIDDNGIPENSCWCSVCGEWLVASDEYSTKGNFCPNCGARMK